MLFRSEKVTAYTVSLRSGGKWREVFSGESIGLCRIRRFAETEGDALKVAVKSALAPVPELSVCAALAPGFRRDERETLRHPDYRKLENPAVSGMEMVFELPEETELHGFVFTPVAGRPAGMPSHCRIFAWRDGEWQCIGGAEFSNVRANPVPQVAYFSGTRAKRLKFVATRLLEPAPELLCAEFGILSCSH